MQHAHTRDGFGSAQSACSTANLPPFVARRAQISRGIEPTTDAFSSMYISVKDVRPPKAGGTSPSKLLPDRSNLDNACNDPNSSGINPLIWFWFKSNSCREASCAISGAMYPVSGDGGLAKLMLVITSSSQVMPRPFKYQSHSSTEIANKPSRSNMASICKKARKR